METAVRVVWFHDLNECHYELPVAQLREFCNRIRSEGMDAAWDWFTSNVDYDNDGSKPIKEGSHLPANHDLWVLGLNHDNYVEDGFLEDADMVLNGA